MLWRLAAYVGELALLAALQQRVAAAEVIVLRDDGQAPPSPNDRAVDPRSGYMRLTPLAMHVKYSDVGVHAVGRGVVALPVAQQLENEQRATPAPWLRPRRARIRVACCSEKTIRN